MQLNYQTTIIQDLLKPSYGFKSYNYGFKEAISRLVEQTVPTPTRGNKNQEGCIDSGGLPLRSKGS